MRQCISEMNVNKNTSHLLKLEIFYPSLMQMEIWRVVCILWMVPSDPQSVRCTIVYAYSTQMFSSQFCTAESKRAVDDYSSENGAAIQFYRQSPFLDRILNTHNNIFAIFCLVLPFLTGLIHDQLMIST